MKLTRFTTILLSLAAVLIIISIFLPWWGMKFYAPQYPEGLDIIVYSYKMAGKIDIINGLNHYIGMKNFSEASFPELKFLPYLLGGMALLTLIVGIMRNRIFLYVLIAIFIIGGGLGIYDIHRWLADYGTDLDPHAPIKMAPFVPPIIGSNKIANFTTYSYFTYGAYLFGLAFVLLLITLWKERRT